MLEGIPAAWLTQGGAVGFLAVAVLGVLRGWLVPGKSLEKMLALHAERLAEERQRGDEWKAAATAALAANAEKDKLLDQLLEAGRTTNALLGTLKAASGTPHGRGGNR